MAELKATKVKLRDGSPCLVRSARERDARELLGYLDMVGGESPYLEFGAGEYALSEADERNVIRTLSAAWNCLLLVAEVGEEIVGTLSVHGQGATRLQHHAWLGINVARDYWGLGVGRTLMETALGWAGAHPALRKISLFVHHENRRAIALYAALGFAEEGRIAGMLRVDGRYHDALCMSRDV